MQIWNYVGSFNMTVDLLKFQGFNCCLGAPNAQKCMPACVLKHLEWFLESKMLQNACGHALLSICAPFWAAGPRGISFPGRPRPRACPRACLSHPSINGSTTFKLCHRLYTKSVGCTVEKQKKKAAAYGNSTGTFCFFFWCWIFVWT